MRSTGRRRRGLGVAILLAAAAVLGPVGSAPASAATDPDANADVVVIKTALGDVYVQMLPSVAPKTVAAFLARVSDHSYDNTFVHNATGNSSTPGSIIQGGYYTADRTGSSIGAVPTRPTVPHETGGSNLRGTIALAHSGTDVNSGSTAWFINDTDNPQYDAQHFPAFGRVVRGMEVVDAIEALRTYDGTAACGTNCSSIPVTKTSGQPTNADLVYTDGMTDLGPPSSALPPSTPPSTPPTTPPSTPAPAYHLAAAAVSAPKRVEPTAAKIALAITGAPTGSVVTAVVKIPGARATATARATSDGRTKVTVKLDAKQRAHLRATHATILRVTLTVAPPDGVASSVTRTLELA